MDWDALPGGALVRRGVEDLDRGEVTDASLLVSLAATRLRSLGVELHDPTSDADHRLWELLAEDDVDGAHGRMNALVRELVSFERALACAA
jgi:hypothetical protein